MKKTAILALICLLTALGLFLGGCQAPDDMGLDLEDNNSLIGTYFTDTVTITMDIVKMDTINTTSNIASSSPFWVVGRGQDAYFGTYKAHSYARMILSESNMKFENAAGEPYILDSLLLRLQLGNVLGDRTTPHKLELYRNLQTLSPDSTYYQYDRLQIEEQPLAIAYYPQDLDSNNVLSFKLSEAFAQELFSKGGKDELADQPQFAEFFKGFAIKSASPDANSIISFDVRQIRTFLGMYYHLASSDTVPRLRRIASFGAHFCNFESDLSTSQYLQDLTPETPVVSDERINNLAFVQGGTGILTRIRFPHIADFAQGRKIMVNRAELEIDPLPEHLGNTRTGPPFLYFYHTNRTGTGLFEINPFTKQPMTLMRETDPTQPLAFVYNSGGRSYTTVQMTAYIQRLIEGAANNNSLIFVPSGNTYSLNSVVMGNNAHTQRRMRLKIYYTEVP
jgi:hypothetical protein